MANLIKQSTFYMKKNKSKPWLDFPTSVNPTQIITNIIITKYNVEINPIYSTYFKSKNKSHLTQMKDLP